MLEKIKANKKLVLIAGGSAAMLLFVAILKINRLVSLDMTNTGVSVGQCVVLYNSCAFTEEKNEPWENTCDPIFKTFETTQVGEKKILAKDLMGDYQMVFPKAMVRTTAKKSEDSVTNSLYLYIHDCEKAKKAVAVIPQKVDQQKKEVKIEKAVEVKATEEVSLDASGNPEKFPEGTWESLSDHCVAVKKDCGAVERWEQDKYCHPYGNSFKIIEVGKKNLRVVTWHGSGNVENGKPQVIGNERMLTQEEYAGENYVVVDCGEMVSKYSKTFNPLKGK